MIKSVGVCSALGRTSAYTWMKLPVVPEMERVMDSTTFPTLLLGGDPDTSPEETYASWRAALQLPAVRGLVVGRTLLYPGRRRRRGGRRHRRRHGPLTGSLPDDHRQAPTCAVQASHQPKELIFSMTTITEPEAMPNAELDIYRSRPTAGCCRTGRAGAPFAGDVGPHRPRSSTRPPGRVTKRVALASRADAEAVIAAAHAAFPAWRDISLARRTQVLFRFRELLNERKHEAAEIITSEHGKVLSDALGEVTRGQEVVEFACGLAHLLKGSHDRERLHQGRRVLAAAAAGRRRDHLAVQLPGDGADVVLPDRDRGGQHASSSSPARRTRRRRTGWPRCGRRPACRTGCSTCCTATRSRSTRCWKTRG